MTDIRLDKWKLNLLKDAGYVYRYQNMVWINTKEKRAFSLEFLDSRCVTELDEIINYEHKDWELFFLQNLSPAAQKEIIKDLDGYSS